MSARSRRLLVVMAVVALLGTGCSDKGEGESSPVTATDAGSKKADGTNSWIGINTLANYGDAAIVGTVAAVSPPKPLSGSMLYREYIDVTVAIESVLFDSPALPLKPNSIVTVHSFGNGRPEGEVESTASGTPIHANQLDGAWAMGDKVLLVLGDDGGVFPHEGPTPDAAVVNGYQGHWTITAAGEAVSADPNRKADVARLRARLVAERAHGRDAARDRCTEGDPFGDEKPACQNRPIPPQG